MNADTKTFEQRAREILAAEYAKAKNNYCAEAVRGERYYPLGHLDVAVNAIIAAISSAAEAKGVEYDRHLIAEMLNDYR